MRELPNGTVEGLCRVLPIILKGIDSDKVVSDTRLANAVRITKHHLLPRLKKIGR